MKKILLTAFPILCSVCAFGQKGFGIKIYQNTDIFSAEYHDKWNNTRTTVDNVNFTRFSLAANFQTKGNFVHEVELLIPEISKSLDDLQYPMDYEFRKDDTFEGEATSYSLRYELSRRFTNEANRLAFSLGAGINPYYVHVEYIPNVETTYYFSSKLYGFVFNVTPRISYKITDRINIDLNIPIKVYDLRGEKIQVNNPAIPIRQQTTNDFNNIFFEDAYTIRIGFMYRVTK